MNKLRTTRNVMDEVIQQALLNDFRISTAIRINFALKSKEKFRKELLRKAASYVKLITEIDNQAGGKNAKKENSIMGSAR